MNKYVKTLAVLSVAIGVSFTGMQNLYARENPYANVEILNMSTAQEADYIDEQVNKFFNSTASTANEAYIVPDNWKQEKLNFDGVPVEKYTSTTTQTDRIVLFLHGGGYVGGLNNRYRDWGLHQAELAGNATLLAVDYRLAPQNVYPTALNDAVTAYKGLLKAGYNPENMILVGDSAGGNLAAALAVYLRDNKIPQPKAIVLISPWTYMGKDLPSHKMNLAKDKILGYNNKRLLPEIEQSSYAKGKDITDPYLSPAYADLTGIAPMLLTVGGNELFLDDVAVLAAHAKVDGVDVTEKVYANMSHDWTILLPELPETKAMNEDITNFINKHLD